MENEITDQMILEYVNRGGNYCPFCKSEQTEGTGKTEFDIGIIEHQMCCLGCSRRWWEQYKLTAIGSQE
jgi:hypothetical protein